MHLIELADRLAAEAVGACCPDTQATLRAAARVVAALLGGPCADCGDEMSAARQVGALCRPCYVRQRRRRFAPGGRLQLED